MGLSNKCIYGSYKNAARCASCTAGGVFVLEGKACGDGEDAIFCGGLDGGFVTCCDALSNGEAKAVAAALTVAGAIGAVEAFKKAGGIEHCAFSNGVGNGKLCLFIMFAEGDVNCSAARGILAGIVQQNGTKLFELDFVALKRDIFFYIVLQKQIIF